MPRRGAVQVPDDIDDHPALSGEKSNWTQALRWLARSISFGKTYYSLTVLATVLAAAFTGVAGMVSSGWRWWAFGGGLLFIAIQLGLAHAKDWAEKDLQGDGEQSELVALIDSYLTDALDWVVKALADKDPATRDAKLAIARQTIVNAAQMICGPSDQAVRATYFEASSMGRNGYCLQPAGLHAGVSPHSHREFKRSDGAAGADVWKIAGTGAPKLWPDLTSKTPPNYERGDNHYQTFIQCGVLDGTGRVLGMLTVDAPTARTLTTTDERIVQHLCRLLAVVEELRRC